VRSFKKLHSTNELAAEVISFSAFEETLMELASPECGMNVRSYRSVARVRYYAVHLGVYGIKIGNMKIILLQWFTKLWACRVSVLLTASTINFLWPSS
jgi:hypothetical protein